VLKLVRRLADRGLAVVLISHNMNDVFAVADDIAVLYLGQMAARVGARDVSHNQVVELITAGKGGAPGPAASAAGNGPAKPEAGSPDSGEEVTS
jgi:D-xylose transport system ATP-binding protein